MPDDVRAALNRFQNFLGRYAEQVIDEESGFSWADGMMLVGEVEMSTAHLPPDEQPID
ncbi:hypothetical protein ACKU27_00905 [Sphingobium yanoikuyae]|jgi:hypothetical protein|uniref:hypothetical protein n=1 Tax=Sphingobium yanoikuyae TaxID=13690 RepID=UPI003B9027D1